MDSNEKIKMDHAAGYLHENISMLNIRQTMLLAGYHEEYPLSKNFYYDKIQSETAVVDYRDGFIAKEKVSSIPDFFAEMRIKYREKNGPLLPATLTDKELLEFDGYKESSPGYFKKLGQYPIIIDYDNGEVNTRKDYTLEEFILENIEKFSSDKKAITNSEKIINIVDKLLDNAKKLDNIDRSKVNFKPAIEMHGWINDSNIIAALAKIGLRPEIIPGSSAGFGLLKEEGKEPVLAFVVGGFKYDNVSLSTLEDNPKAGNGIWFQNVHNQNIKSPTVKPETHIFESIPEALGWLKINKGDLDRPTFVVSTEGRATKEAAEEIVKNIGRSEIIVHYTTKELQDKNQAFVDELNKLHGCIVYSGVDWIDKGRVLGMAEAQEKSKVIAEYLKSLTIPDKLDSGDPTLLPKYHITCDGNVYTFGLKKDIDNLEYFTGENLILNEKLRRENREWQKGYAREIAAFEREYFGDGTQFTFKNGESLALYHNKEIEELQLGSVTNAGLHPQFSIKIDYSLSFYDNFSSLLEKAYEERPELLGEEEQSRSRGI